MSRRTSGADTPSRRYAASVTVSWPTVEAELCRIPHVLRAHVVRDASETVRELHIVASPGKPAKQVVRDVQSVAMASFGIDVDRNVVSVVQLEDRPHDEQRTQPLETPLDGAAPPPAGAPFVPPARTAEGSSRVLLTGMTLQSHQGRCLVWVVLRSEDREVTGHGVRPATALGVHRVVAEATLDALGQLHPDGLASDIDTVEVRQLGTRRVALVSVVHRTGGNEDAFLGSATVRAAGDTDAVARAVLDAMNRRVSR